MLKKSTKGFLEISLKNSPVSSYFSNIGDTMNKRPGMRRRTNLTIFDVLWSSYLENTHTHTKFFSFYMSVLE